MTQVLQGIPAVVYFIDEQVGQGRSMKPHCSKCWTGYMPMSYVLLKKSKYLFSQEELEFLGHRISKDGIKPTQKCIESIQHTPAPNNKHELLSVFGYDHLQCKIFAIAFTYLVSITPAVAKEYGIGMENRTPGSICKSETALM